MKQQTIDTLLYTTTQNLTLTANERELLAGYLRETITEWIIRVRKRHEPFMDRLKILTDALCPSGHNFAFYFPASAHHLGKDHCNDICFKRCLEMLFYHTEAENLLTSLTRK